MIRSSRNSSLVVLSGMAPAGRGSPPQGGQAGAAVFYDTGNGRQSAKR